MKGIGVAEVEKINILNFIDDNSDPKNELG